MRRLIVGSKEDDASLTMFRHFVEARGPEEVGDGLYADSSFVYMLVERRHIYCDNVDKDPRLSGEAFKDVVFLSRHSSSAQIKSLTVHPTGNFGPADLGGRERTVSVSDPGYMLPTLKELREAYSGNGYEITFEATHHGPYMETPNFYIEIGTTPEDWHRPEVLDAVLRAVESAHQCSGPTFIGGVGGGGHYMPKITEYAVENGIPVGHMVSKHSLAVTDRSGILEAIRKTPGCRGGILVDRKGVKSEGKAIVSAVADELGMETVII